MLSFRIPTSIDAETNIITLQLFDDEVEGDEPVSEKTINVSDLIDSSIEEQRSLMVRTYLQQKQEKAEKAAALAATIATITPILDQYREPVEITQEEIDSYHEMKGDGSDDSLK